MQQQESRQISLGHILFGLAILSALFLGMRTSAQDSDSNPTHLPTDWSHRHVVFSRPDSIWHEWELEKDPRYRHQLTRRNSWELGSANLRGRKHERDEDRDQDKGGDGNGSGPVESLSHRDWAVSLGNLGTVGAGNFPAKFSFNVNTTPSCTADYVAFTTSLVGSATVPSIVGFDNLYSTQPAAGGFCNTIGPSVKWAYNTNPAGDTTGKTLTSAALSLDGTKIAFVESRTNANGGSILHILKWKPGAGATVQGTMGAPATPDTLLTAGQSWTANCPAANSCLVNLVFNGAQQDTNSPPFYDFVADAMYAGDNNGVLHKFTGVFLGTPAEVTTGGWPLTVNATATLTGPVLDGKTENIFVADNTGRLSFVKEVGSVTGTCASGSPPCLGSVSQSLTGNIVDPPMIDTTTGHLLVVDGTETSGNDGSLFQFDMALTTASKVTVKIGGNQGATPTAADVLHIGTFDSAYFSAGPASGHFYTCGRDPGFNNRPAIYQLSFNASGVLQTTGIPAPLKSLTSNFSLIGDACSPVTELKNGATDRIFFSVATNADPPTAVPAGTATGCTNGQGCVIMIELGGTWPPAATTAGFAVPFNVVVQTGSGGASGIVVDNVGVGAQESSIYFTYQTNSTLGVPCNGTIGVGCAVKLTQSALQ